MRNLPRLRTLLTLNATRIREQFSAAVTALRLQIATGHPLDPRLPPGAFEARETCLLNDEAAQNDLDHAPHESTMRADRGDCQSTGDESNDSDR